jgi:hypothetical protein
VWILGFLCVVVDKVETVIPDLLSCWEIVLFFTLFFLSFFFNLFVFWELWKCSGVFVNHRCKVEIAKDGFVYSLIHLVNTLFWPLLWKMFVINRIFILFFYKFFEDHYTIIFLNNKCISLLKIWCGVNICVLSILLISHCIVRIRQIWIYLWVKQDEFGRKTNLRGRVKSLHWLVIQLLRLFWIIFTAEKVLSVMSKMRSGQDKME